MWLVLLSFAVVGVPLQALLSLGLPCLVLFAALQISGMSKLVFLLWLLLLALSIGDAAFCCNCDSFWPIGTSLHPVWVRIVWQGLLSTVCSACKCV